MNAIIDTCEYNNFEMVLQMIRDGANPNVTNVFGQTPLFYACERSSLYYIKSLIDVNADVNHQDKEGYTCMMRACETRRKDVISLLIQHGADMYIRNVYDQNVLGLMIQNNDRHMVQFLLDLGCVIE